MARKNGPNNVPEEAHNYHSLKGPTMRDLSRRRRRRKYAQLAREWRDDANRNTRPRLMSARSKAEGDDPR